MVIRSPPLSSTCVALLVGLLASQAIGTAQVYLSNIDLFNSLVSIRDAGYLPVPSEKVMPRLEEIGTAFWGGLFFTFTVGAGLSLLSLAAALVWDRIFLRGRFILALCLLLWAALLFAVNRRGFSPLVSAYVLFIPPLVFVMAGHGVRAHGRNRAWVRSTVHFLPVLLLSILWASQVDKGFFTDLRDRLLLSNAAGRTVSEFYYEYNLYAAEAFKNLDQKMLRTCNLRFQLRSASHAVERELINYDYLNTGDKKVDLAVEEDSEALVLKHGGKETLRIRYKEFMSNPGGSLKEFSRKSDRHAFFRSVAFFGLWTFPLALYIILHGLVSIPLSFFANRSASSYVATALCFCAGLLLFLFFYVGKEGEIKESMAADSLAASRWQTRVAGLKAVEKHRMDILDFREYPSLRHSSRVAERYWVARALAASRKPDTLNELRSFLADPSPNVVTQALYSLGERKNQAVVPEILRFIKDSDNWYCQWYAYRALRTLGWKQKKGGANVPHPDAWSPLAPPKAGKPLPPVQRGGDLQ